MIVIIKSKFLHLYSIDLDFYSINLDVFSIKLDVHLIHLLVHSKKIFAMTRLLNTIEDY